MILHRFCSIKEFKEYRRGSILTNTTDHAAHGRRSNAVGFCFFKDLPNEAVHRLSGNVDLDVCITVEVPRRLVRKCRGQYQNWVRPGIREGFAIIDEYCTTEYDSRRFRLIRYTYEFRDYAPGITVLRELFPELYR